MALASSPQGQRNSHNGFVVTLAGHAYPNAINPGLRPELRSGRNPGLVCVAPSGLCAHWVIRYGQHRVA